jgi:hypothetical protein
MKQLTKSSIVAVALVLFGVASVHADNSVEFHNRIAYQNTIQQQSTVAVYTGRADQNSNVQVQQASADVFCLRSNHHGQVRGEYRQGQLQ